MLPMEFLIKRLIETWIFSVIYVIAQCISISKSLIFQLGILLFFLANEEKTTTNNLATNLVFVGSWQILPLRRAYMRAKKQLGIVVSDGGATLGARAKPSGSFSHGSAIVSRAPSPSRRRPALTVTIGLFTISIGQFPVS